MAAKSTRTAGARSGYAHGHIHAHTSGARLAVVLMAFLLGAFFLYGVGFSPVAHDVAHDTRHAIGFPCH